jgi:hypothetical protein
MNKRLKKQKKITKIDYVQYLTTKKKKMMKLKDNCSIKLSTEDRLQEPYFQITTSNRSPMASSSSPST